MIGPHEHTLLSLETVSSESSKPKGTLQNVAIILQNDPRWLGRIRWNEFANAVELHHTPLDPGGVIRAADETDTNTAIWLADHYYRMSIPTARVAEAVYAIARRHSYHPVRDYLTALEWDQQPRLAVFLTDCLGVERTPLNDAIGACFLRSLVARVMRPGCKVDTTPILVGRQGAYKSSALRALVPIPSWFADTKLDMGSKDLFEQIQGRWLYELGELDAFKGRDWSRIKSLLSSQEDTYRRPYGHHAISVARQVVFAGTTNEDEFLGDPTGARRFWPVKVGEIDLEAIEEQRDQLWAEALHTFLAGEPWWLARELLPAAQEAAEEFRQADPWEGVVADWIRGRAAPWTIAEILTEAVKKPRENWTQWDQNRIGGILRALGCRRSRPRVGSTRGVQWSHP